MIEKIITALTDQVAAAKSAKAPSYLMHNCKSPFSLIAEQRWKDKTTLNHIA
ncbi:MAG: hypothetical protein PSV35_07510 [bacterium]|nr:hypothetical protein [bacterium]